MKNNITEAVFILDESGSMGNLTEDTIGGFNSVLESHRSETGSFLVTTVLFSNSSRIIHDRLPIEKVPNLTGRDYCAHGCTALVDAIADAIKHIENIHKYARPEDVPAKTLFLITTDGMENASRKYSSAELKKMITEKQENGWEFVYLAANIDAVETAKHYGIDERNAVNYHNDPLGTSRKFAAMDRAMRLKREDACLADDSDWRLDVDEDFNNR